MIAKRWRYLVAGSALLGLAFRAPLSAHDLERTEVTLAFNPDGTFVLDVANDPDWLVQRLEPFAIEAGLAVTLLNATSSPLSTVDRDRRLATFAPAFIDRVVLWIDGREVRPQSAEFVAPRARTAADDLSPLGTYRLRGRVPGDVRSLRWFYGLVIDDYPMTVRRADGRALNETIFGRAWSGTLDLTGQFTRPSRVDVARRFLLGGISSVVPRGVDHMLFVGGLVLFSIGVRPALIQIATFLFAQTLGIVLATTSLAMPARVIPPVIVLSIVYVVTEGLLTRRLTPLRILLIGVFGFFHGAGLAGALNTLSAPPSAFVTALLAFALGAGLAELVVAVVVSGFRRTRMSRLKPAPTI